MLKILFSKGGLIGLRISVRTINVSLGLTCNMWEWSPGQENETLTPGINDRLQVHRLGRRQV